MVTDYLKRKKSYTKGYVYFPPSAVYENFTDEHITNPVRVDVKAWENLVPGGVTVERMVHLVNDNDLVPRVPPASSILVHWFGTQAASFADHDHQT